MVNLNSRSLKSSRKKNPSLKAKAKEKRITPNTLLMISSSDDEYESAMEKENEPPVATVDHVHVKAASRLRYVQSKIQFGYMSYF